MTLEELDEMIVKRDALVKELGLGEVGIGMQIVLPGRWNGRRPLGEKARTPFGLCPIHTVNREGNIVVGVTLDQMRRYSKKAHRALAEEHAV